MEHADSEEDGGGAVGFLGRACYSEDMAGIIVHGQELSGPDGLTIQNFRTGLVSLKNQARHGNVTQVIVHETVTSSAKATVAVLQQRGLGVHIIVGPDGVIYQHADLQDDECWHASEHNGMSVGIETVNPYQPKFCPNNSPWTNRMKAPWAGGDYVVPTPEQSETVALLLDWLTTSSGLSIPKTWVGMEDKSLSMGRFPASDRGPGIYAHHYFADHIDGMWLVLYSWLRLEAQLDPSTAYSEAMRRGAVMSVDLSDYFSAPTDPNPDQVA